MIKRILATLASSYGLVLFALVPLVEAQTNKNKLENPLSPEFSTIPNFISGALKVLVMISLPIITLFFVYAGYKFIAAQGNQEKLGDAKQNFLYVVIGAILILGAWVIATLIGGTVTQLTKG